MMVSDSGGKGDGDRSGGGGGKGDSDNSDGSGGVDGGGEGGWQ